MPIVYPYTQYGGIWKLNAASAAQGAGTWPSPPQPYLWSWGQNGYGDLGLNDTTNRSSPTQVGSLSNWLNVAAGYYISAAIKTNGTLWTWGYNDQGQLGLGNQNNYSSPKQVGALTDWASIYPSNFKYCLAIKKNGTLWAWGSNLYGTLGTGNATYYSSPVQIGALTNWSTASAGSSFAAAIKTDGTLWTWGYNNAGQLGLGNTTRTYSPQQVGALTNWSLVSCGASFALAIKTDGTIWSWGGGGSGVLGLGNTTNYSSPKQIGSLTNWNVLSKGSFGSSFAIKTDGTLWSWGGNYYGQLGYADNVGSFIGISSPKQIGTLTNWLKISSGAYNAYAIKTDGTLWSWGANGSGQLGLGNTTYYSSPKQVGMLSLWNDVYSGRFGNVVSIKSA